MDLILPGGRFIVSNPRTVRGLIKQALKVTASKPTGQEGVVPANIEQTNTPGVGENISVKPGNTERSR